MPPLTPKMDKNIKNKQDIFGNRESKNDVLKAIEDNQSSPETPTESESDEAEIIKGRDHKK